MTMADGDLLLLSDGSLGDGWTQTCSARSAGPRGLLARSTSWQARGGKRHLRSADEMTAMPLKRPRVAATFALRREGAAWITAIIGRAPTNWERRGCRADRGDEHITRAVP